VATTDTAGVYAQRLLDNDYVQQNLVDAADALRAAYRRASKRRVEPARDEKLRLQLRQAALSIGEAASSLKSGRRRPKGRRRRQVLVILGLGAAVAAVVASGRAKRKLLGSPSPAHPGSVQTPASSDPRPAQSK
jgi:hypothetical protein